MFATLLLFWLMLMGRLTVDVLVVGILASLVIALLYPNGLSFFTEFRAYMWPDQFENVQRAPGPGRFDPSTWLQSDSTFVANTSIQLGFTFFFPIKFEYRLPK